MQCAAIPAPAKTVFALSDVPAPIRQELASRISSGRTTDLATLMADHDGDWEATDVVRPGSKLLFRRFIQAGQSGDRWYVWYERGGIAHFDYAVVLALPAGGAAAQVIMHASGMAEALCSATGPALAPDFAGDGGAAAIGW